MTKFRIIALIGFVTLFTASCSRNDEPGEPPTTGFLVDAKHAGTVSKSDIQQKLPAELSILKPFMINDFKVFRVKYNTKLNEDKILVSGLFVVPVNVSAQTPVMVHTHGTISESGIPPSQSDLSSFSSEAAIGYVAASVFNCAVLLPDYIGYGSSSSMLHPYVHAETLGQTSLDLIKAYIEFTETTANAVPANKNIVITGYSEGGYAAVALHKKIQETAPNLKIIKTFAGAGPYDMPDFLKELISLDIEVNPTYVSSYLWALATYKNYMNYSRPYDEIFSAEDNAVLAAANYQLGYLKQHNINRNPRKLFKQSFIEQINANTDTELSNLLKQNDLTTFVPSDSLILFHSEADSWVFVNNAKNAYNEMRKKNAPVRAYIIPKEQNKDHGDAGTEFFQFIFFNLFSTVFR